MRRTQRLDQKIGADVTAAEDSDPEFWERSFHDSLEGDKWKSLVDRLIEKDKLLTAWLRRLQRSCFMSAVTLRPRAKLVKKNISFLHVN